MRHRSERRRGLSLIEVIVSLLITTVLITSAMRAVTAAKHRERTTLSDSDELFLANDLLNEVLLQAFSEPESLATFGPELNEAASNRRAFDDVDDYHLLVESPPLRRDGSVLSQFNDLKRMTTVTWVSDIAPHGAASSGSGLKKIEVCVKRGNTTLCTVSAYRSAGFQNRARP